MSRFRRDLRSDRLGHDLFRRLAGDLRGMDMDVASTAITHSSHRTSSNMHFFICNSIYDSSLLVPLCAERSELGFFLDSLSRRHVCMSQLKTLPNVFTLQLRLFTSPRTATYSVFLQSKIWCRNGLLWCLLYWNRWWKARCSTWFRWYSSLQRDAFARSPSVTILVDDHATIDHRGIDHQHHHRFSAYWTVARHLSATGGTGFTAACDDFHDLCYSSEMDRCSMLILFFNLLLDCLSE